MELTGLWRLQMLKAVEAVPDEDEVSRELHRTASLVLSRTSCDAIQTLAQQELVVAQSILGHGERFGTWFTPFNWAHTAPKSHREINLTARITAILEDISGAQDFQAFRLDAEYPRLLEEAVLSCARYCVLCRFAPVSLRPFGRFLMPSLLAPLVFNTVTRMAALSVRKALEEDAFEDSLSVMPANGRCFARLTVDDLESELLSASQRDAIAGELRRMRYLADQGLWSDVGPAPRVLRGGNSPEMVTPVKGAEQPAQPTPEPDPFLPFPDHWVSEMGRKCHWLVTAMHPNLMACLKGFRPIWKRAAANGLSASRISEDCNKYLRAFQWRGKDGKPLKLPFALDGYSTSADADPLEEKVWPPRTFDDVIRLVNATQGAHLFVTTFCTAPRNGETGITARSCVERAKDGRKYRNGKTYKLVRTVGGATRDWLLPDFAAMAFAQQAELVAAYECLSPITYPMDPDKMPVGNFLWGQAANREPGAPPLSGQSINDLLRNLAEALEMDMNPGGQSIRLHRFRKTLARLAALALVNAPRILMDVFGHKSIEMTLYYIMTDKDLAQDARKVARELRVLRCKTALEQLCNEEDEYAAARQAAGPKLRTFSFGGKGVDKLVGALNSHRAQVAQRGATYSPQDLNELVEFFVMSDTAFSQVAPGVLCTKTEGQVGECNKKRGYPEMSNCTTTCDHRLDEPWLRRNVDACIAEAAEKYVECVAAGKDLVASFWAGQVRSHLFRFDDIRQKWLNHAVVQDVLTSTPAANEKEKT
jgi:integrase